mmetsp:Transcript_31107/g.49953  ORF Transcript_31107/g.49953 Transcript_31107/m.49953 type:complete len:80 (-) Transcript_31107:307-546(-)
MSCLTCKLHNARTSFANSIAWGGRSAQNGVAGTVLELLKVIKEELSELVSLTVVGGLVAPCVSRIQNLRRNLGAKLWNL